MTPEHAIEQIRRVLADDVNYQTADLKLGGIWHLCDTVASYRRFSSDFGRGVEVILKKDSK